MKRTLKINFAWLLTLCLLFAANGKAQDANTLLVKADSLLELKEFQNALDLVNKAISAKPSKFVLSQANFRLSKAYLGLQDFDKAVYFNNQSLSLLEDLRYEFIADNYALFGHIEMKRGQKDKALNYFFKALELPYETIEFSGLVYANIALIYFQKGEMNEVLKYYSIAMETMMTAFEEANILDLNHYRIRGNRLYYDRFFIGYL